MTRPRTGWRAAALAALIAIAGCATPRVPASDWLGGHLSVQVAALADRPARSVSSAFDLRGDAERGELRLATPLGTVVADAFWAPGEARLVTSDGETRYPDLDALAREALGEALPLQALPAWLRGRPWPGTISRNTAEGFEQLGWTVDLRRYAQGWLEITRAAPPAVTLRARLEPDS